MAAAWLLGAVIMVVKIVWLPFAWAHLKLGAVALWLIGKMIVPIESRVTA